MTGTSPPEGLERPGGLPPGVLVAAYVIVLVGTLLLGAGVLMANVMSCDAGGDNCANNVLLATIAWAVISFALPLVALLWGLTGSQETSSGRRRRVIALVLIIVLPALGLAVNLGVLQLLVFQ